MTKERLHELTPTTGQHLCRALDPAVVKQLGRPALRCRHLRAVGGARVVARAVEGRGAQGDPRAAVVEGSFGLGRRCAVARAARRSGVARVVGRTGSGCVGCVAGGGGGSSSGSSEEVDDGYRPR